MKTAKMMVTTFNPEILDLSSPDRATIGGVTVESPGITNDLQAIIAKETARIFEKHGARAFASSKQSTAVQRAFAPARSKLGVKGVWIRHGKYVAEIRIARQKKYLGCFDTLEEANTAYAKAAKDAFGLFARAR